MAQVMHRLNQSRRMGATANAGSTQTSAANANVAILSQNDLQTIRGLVSSDCRSKKREELDPIAERAAERAKVMMQIDASRKEQGARKEDWQAMEDAERAAIRDRASRLIAEDCDEVKAMNALIREAKTVAVRDRQIAEKKHLAAERAAAEAATLDALETERARALRLYEQREQHRADDRRRGAEVIRRQMALREQQRLRDLEEKSLEHRALQEATAAAEAREKAVQESRREAARALVREVAEFNATAVQIAHRRSEEEKAEDARIAHYLAEKARRDEALAEEASRSRVAREREAARMRTRQERAQDDRAELDELRARRHTEEAERAAREREAREAQERTRRNEALLTSRTEQLALKKAAREEAAREERQLRAQAQAEAERVEQAERERAILRVARKSEQRNVLESQIDERRQRLEREREEEKRLFGADEEHRRIAALRQIHAAKVREIEMLDVPESYKNKLRGMGSAFQEQ